MSVIRIEEIDVPKVGAGQVLVEVRAASINPFDTAVRSGAYKETITLDLPVTLGGDIAGTVTEVGENVSGVAVGDKVYGQANAVAGNSGAFAEYAVTAESQISGMPAGLDYNQAASLPLVGVSAIQAVVEHLDLQSGQKIFIHGGAGGIGTIAIQIAKQLGAYIATTATDDGIDYVKQLGANEVIDYQSQSFTEVLRDYDAVFDTVGGEDFSKSFSILNPEGKAVSMIAHGYEEQAERLGITAVTQSTRVTTERLSRLREFVESGAITPHVDKVFPLEQVQEAFAARESGTVKGKVVLEIRP